MVKGGRKQKQKKKDFQKVKLKAGKVKPQADNFTNTTFKSHAIQIKEQLKAGDTSQPTNQRKQNIHDLICHLNHYNATIRHTSVFSIKELLTSHPDLISQNLSLLINNLAVLLTDKDDSVRKAGVSVLQHVMKSISANQISPFFPIINAHICCAMTHIIEDIQIDSLAVLDCVLQQYPELVVPHSKGLLTNFVHQISQQKKVVQGKKDMLGSDLSVNPSSAMSSQKWRIKVLQRLQQFLGVLVSEKHQGGLSLQQLTPQQEVHVNQDVSHVQILRKKCLQEGFILRSVAKDSQPVSATGASGYTAEDMFRFITSLVPLLMQCWAEVSPRQQYGNKMTPNAWETLDGVLKVLQLLWRWMEQTESDREYITELQKRYLKTFNQQLLPLFPYNANITSPGRGKNSTGVSSATIATINLAACDIMSYFVAAGKMEQNWIKKVMRYVLATLTGDGCDLPTEHVQSLLHVTGCLVNVIPDQGMVQELVEALGIFYEKCHLKSQNKRLALNHLAKLTVLDENNKQLLECSATNQWLISLPKFLLKVKHADTNSVDTALSILLQAASRQNSQALETLQQNISHLIDSKDGLLLHIPSTLQRKAVELLHHVKHIDGDLWKELSLVCHDPRLDIQALTYMLHTLTIWVSSHTSYTQMFHSFLFSVSIGCTRAHLDSCQSTKDSGGQLTSITLVQQDTGLVDRYAAINKDVCMCFGVVGSKSQLWTILQDAILNILTCYQSIPYTTALAILHISSTLGSPPNHLREDLTNKLTILSLAVLTHAIGSQGMDCEEGSWKSTLWKAAVKVMSQQEHLWEQLCQEFSRVVPGVDNLDDLDTIMTVMTRLLQTKSMMSCVQRCQEQLNTTVQVMLDHPLLVSLETRWLAEFRYETGLVLNQVDRIGILKLDFQQQSGY